MNKRLIGLFSILCMPIIAFAAQGIWTTYQGNPAHTGVVRQTVKPDRFHVLWSRKLTNDQSQSREPESYSLKGPVVTDKLIYFIATDGYSVNGDFYALDVASGKTVWRVPMDYYSNLTAPAFANDRLFIVASGRNANTTLKSFNAISGELIFTIPLDSSGLSDLSPLAIDDAVYTCTMGLFRTNAATGSHDWVNKYIYSSYPVYSKHTLFIANDNQLTIVDAENGRMDVELSLDGASYNYFRDTIPIIDDVKHMLYGIWSFNDFENHIYLDSLVGIDLAKKQVRFQTPFSVSGQPLLLDESIAVYTVDSLKKIKLLIVSADNGQIKWDWYPDNGDKLSSSNRLVSTGEVIFVPGENNTYAVSAKTHKTVWKSALHGRMSLGLNTLFIISNDDTVTAIGLN